MDTCEAAPVSAQEIRIQCLGTPEIDSPLSSNMATGGERRVVFNVDEELLEEGAAPCPMSFELAGPQPDLLRSEQDEVRHRRPAAGCARASTTSSGPS